MSLAVYFFKKERVMGFIVRDKIEKMYLSNSFKK